jgi:hypothetical protein
LNSVMVSFSLFIIYDMTLLLFFFWRPVFTLSRSGQVRWVGGGRSYLPMLWSEVKTHFFPLVLPPWHGLGKSEILVG